MPIKNRDSDAAGINEYWIIFENLARFPDHFHFFPGVAIAASGDFDEGKIARLKQAGGEIDIYGVGTNPIHWFTCEWGL